MLAVSHPEKQGLPSGKSPSEGTHGRVPIGAHRNHAPPRNDAKASFAPCLNNRWASRRFGIGSGSFLLNAAEGFVTAASRRMESSNPTTLGYRSARKKLVQVLNASLTVEFLVEGVA